MPDTFIGEDIRPVPGAQAAPVSAGGPAVPVRFVWRGREHEIAEVLESWRETGPCHHGSGERYVRKHWFRVSVSGVGTMTIYFERHGRSGGKAARRWRLYTVEQNPA